MQKNNKQRDGFAIYINDDHLLLFDKQLNAHTHRHQFIHLLISLSTELTLQLERKIVTCQGVIIGSMVEHTLLIEGDYALLLIDPTTLLGRGIRDHYLSDSANYQLLPTDQVTLFAHWLRIIAEQGNSVTHYQHYWYQILEILGLTHCRLQHTVQDPRIIQALYFINSHEQFHFTLAQVAAQVHLSPSRFSHLFKAYTGSSLKSYLLFKQLISALVLIVHGQSITDAAMQSGFDSPSHLSATCRKLMGLAPNYIYQVSRFLKVCQFH